MEGEGGQILYPPSRARNSEPHSRARFKCRQSGKGCCPPPHSCIPANAIGISSYFSHAAFTYFGDACIFCSPFSVSEQCFGDSGFGPGKMCRPSSRSASVSVSPCNVLSVFVIIIVNLLSMLHFVEWSLTPTIAHPSDLPLFILPPP